MDKYLNSNIIYDKDNDFNKDIKLKNKSNKKKNENEIIDLSEYKENECESITNSEKSLENLNLNSSSKEFSNLLNIETSNGNHLKPEIMEINLKNYHLNKYLIYYLIKEKLFIYNMLNKLLNIDS